jgi:CO/xanthine dehydrogenase Mo-binding subunit
MGGIVWGIGMALEEESVMDQKFGRFINHNLAEYHVPVNADVHDIDVIFVEETDSIVNPLGAKGLGEPGVVGVAAAIANASSTRPVNESASCRSLSTKCCGMSLRSVRCANPPPD